MSIVYADEARPANDKLIVIGDAKAKRKAEAMIKILKDSLFWHALTRFVQSQCFTLGCRLPSSVAASNASWSRLLLLPTSHKLRSVALTKFY